MSKKVPAFKRKKKNRISFFIILAVVVIFCSYFVIKGVSLYNDRSQLKSDIDNLNTQIDKENQRTEDLKEEETYMHTMKYAEEVAKEKLGYVYENEIIFRPE